MTAAQRTAAVMATANGRAKPRR